MSTIFDKYSSKLPCIVAPALTGSYRSDVTTRPTKIGDQRHRIRGLDHVHHSDSLLAGDHRHGDAGRSRVAEAALGSSPQRHHPGLDDLRAPPGGLPERRPRLGRLQGQGRNRGPDGVQSGDGADGGPTGSGGAADPKVGASVEECVAVGQALVEAGHIQGDVLAPSLADGKATSTLVVVIESGPKPPPPSPPPPPQADSTVSSTAVRQARESERDAVLTVRGLRTGRSVAACRSA